MANTTWSTTDKTASITLSGGNLTAAATAASGIRAVDRQVTGKFYWEITFNTAGGFFGAGIASVAAALNTLYATPNNALIVYATGGAIWVNNVNIGVAVGALNTAGSLLCCALDANGMFWARNGAAGNWNGNAGANPAIGGGGINVSAVGGSAIPLHPAACFTGTGSITANFGDSAFVGAVPAGFTSGFTAGAVIPTSLVAQSFVRETIGTATGELRVQGLVREVIGAPGVGQNRLLVHGLVREVIGVPGAPPAPGSGLKQYAVTIIT